MAPWLRPQLMKKRSKPGPPAARRCEPFCGLPCEPFCEPYCGLPCEPYCGPRCEPFCEPYCGLPCGRRGSALVRGFPTS